jgi:hypothetical protein
MCLLPSWDSDASKGGDVREIDVRGICPGKKLVDVLQGKEGGTSISRKGGREEGRKPYNNKGSNNARKQGRLRKKGGKEGRKAERKEGGKEGTFNALFTAAPTSKGAASATSVTSLCWFAD